MKNESLGGTCVYGLQIATAGRELPIVYVGLNETTVVSDEELLDLVSRGDVGAMKPLAERYYAPLVAYAFRLSGGDRGMADVVQDAFVKILRQRSYRSDRPAKPWIYRIVTNCVHDRVRRSSREEGGPVIDQDDAGPHPDELALNAERQGRVRSAVADLPLEFRSVLVLRYYQDLSLAEIGAALNIPLGTVKSRLHAAILRLRNSSLVEVDG